MPTKPVSPPPEADPNYDPFAIFHATRSPIHPGFMREAVRTLLRALPSDPDEPAAWAERRLKSALIGLAALNPRDAIEVMLAVQALAAYYAAAACWRVGMNHHLPNGDSTRHLSAAAGAARTFDTLLKALERRQAKPLVVPLGRPQAHDWPEDPTELTPPEWDDRCQEGIEAPSPPADIVWTEADLTLADDLRDQDDAPDLDAGPIEGVRPDGSIIMPENPTPRQAAYIARRLGRTYRREFQAYQRLGLRRLPKIRGIRPGDLIP